MRVSFCSFGSQCTLVHQLPSTVLKLFRERDDSRGCLPPECKSRVTKHKCQSPSRLLELPKLCRICGMYEECPMELSPPPFPLLHLAACAEFSNFQFPVWMPRQQKYVFSPPGWANYCSKRKSLATRQCSQPISDLGSDRCHCHAHLWTLPVEGRE